MEKINKSKIILFVVLFLMFSLVIFLSINLIKYYNENIRIRKNKDLVYVFDATTANYASHITYEELSSEQYLSYEISYGIDVSEWQGKIDWKKVKTSGITFAIIRCGFREITGSNIKEDARFKENIEGAINAGLTVGVYFFGTAKNEREALEEAEFTYNLIKDYNLTYPVAYDVESLDQGRLNNIDYEIISNNVLTFTEMLSQYGYETMIYSNKNIFTNKLYTGKFDGKLIWLAHYTDITDYKGNYNMWQYTSKGKVDGIGEYVDLNVSYFKYVDDEAEIVENPNYKYPPNVDFMYVDDIVKTKKVIKYRNSPTSEIPNIVGKIKKGEVLKRTGVQEKFSRVIYNDRVVYIENKNIGVVS